MNILKHNIKSLKMIIEDLYQKENLFNEVVSCIEHSLLAGKKILLCGNGGSAAEAQHISAEYVSSLTHDFKRKSLPAISLTTDTSFLTAFSNDFGYDSVFERQVEGLGNKGDVLIGLSTSGNSNNIVKAIEIAKEKGLHTIGITGESGGKLKELCDFCIQIPSSNTQHIQEVSLLIQHSIVEAVEINLFK